MTNIKKIGISLATLSIITIGFSGCGSSNSTNSDSTSGATTSLSGAVADGYLVGATVCLDKNNNGNCDTDEPKAVTGKHGEYTILNVSDADTQNYPILVTIDKTVIDEDDNNTVSQAYTLSAEPGSSFVSPISTMIRKYKVDNNVSYGEAKNRVKKLLGISNDSLLEKDYIASNLQEAADVHEKAKIIAQLKQDIKTELNKSYLGFMDHKAVDEYIDNKVIEKLSDISVEIDSNQVDLNTSIQNILGTIDLSNANADLSGIIDRINQQELQELETNAGTTIHNLTSSMTIQQDTKYTKVYNGGTDIRTFTIADSEDKRCSLYILDSTYAYNPYTSEPYLVDGDSYNGVSPTGKMSIDSSFTLAWQYYTTEGSHFDFIVHCEDIPQADASN